MPRTMEEINKAYTEASTQLGVAHYDLSVALPEKITKLKEKIIGLHKEAEELINENKGEKIE